MHAERMPPSRIMFPSDLADAYPDNAIFRLSEEDVREFQELVHSTSGLWMTPELAAERARSLLMLTRVLLGPLPEDAAPVAVRTSSSLPASPEAR